MRESDMKKKILKLAGLSQTLRKNYLIINKILLFPTIKNLIQSLYEFENKGYLDIVKSLRDYHFLSVSI